MNESILLLLLLFLYTKSSILIPEIIMDSGRSESLATTTFQSYFFMRISAGYYSNLYVHFHDESYKLGQVNYCYSQDEPILPTALPKSCVFFPMHLEYSNSTNDITDYHYSTTSTGNLFFIVQYSGLNSGGSLYVRSSYKATYSIKLSTLAIVLISVGAAIIVIVAIIVIYCVCKPKVIVGGGNFSPSTQPAIGISNNSFPLMEQNNANNPTY